MALDDDGWNSLLWHIEKRRCTPVIGAGASATLLPAAATLANRWATDHGFPFKDSSDLARVSQFIAINRFDMFPKELMVDEIHALGEPDLSGTPYPYLAQLPFTQYITTNYDDFISQALRPARSPRVDYCRWNNFEEVAGKVPPGRTHEPTEAEPLVYHLHGHRDWPASLVLTEEDYLDFLITAAETSKEQSDFLRADVRSALAGTSVLFIGYRLSDWTFRVMFRGLMKSMTASLNRPSVSIQMVPEKEISDEKPIPEDLLLNAQQYLEKYLGRLHRLQSFTMYWGDATEFARELLERWQRWPSKGSSP